MANPKINIQASVNMGGVQSSLNAIASTLNRIHAPARKVDSGFRRMSKGAGGLTRSLQTVAAQFLGLQAAIRVIGFGIKQLSDFEQSMAEVRAITQKTASDKAFATTFNRMSDTARRFGAVTVFSASEAAQGLKFLSMAGFNASQSMNSLGATLRLAQAGSMDLGDAADKMTNIMTAFGLSAQMSNKVTDNLTTIAASSNTSVAQLAEAMKYAGSAASALGLDMEQSAAAIGTLANAGMQASLGGTGLRQVLVKLSTQSGAMKTIMQDLGLTTEDLSLKQNTLAQVVRKFAEAGVNAGQVMEGFGARAGAAFLNLLAGVDTLEELTEAQKNNAGASKMMADTMSDTLKGDVKKLQSAFTELIISQDGLLDSIRELVQGFTDFIKYLNGTLESTSELYPTFIRLKIALKAVGAALAGLAIAGVIKVVSMLTMGVIRLIAAFRAGAIIAWGGAMRGLAATLGFLSKTLLGVTISARGATAAIRSFKIAVASTGIGLLIVLAMELIGVIYEFFTAVDEGAERASSRIRELSDDMKALTKDTGNMSKANRELLEGLAGMEKFKGTDIQENFERDDSTREGEEDPISLFDVQNEQELIAVADNIRSKAKETAEAYEEVKAIQAENPTDDGAERLKVAEEALRNAQANLAVLEQHGDQILLNNQLQEKLNQTLDRMKNINQENVKVMQQATQMMSKKENADIKVLFDLTDAEDNLEDRLNKLSQSIEMRLTPIIADPDLGEASGIKRLEAAIFLDDGQAMEELNDVFADWKAITDKAGQELGGEFTDNFAQRIAQDTKGITLMDDFDTTVAAKADELAAALGGMENLPDEMQKNIKAIAAISLAELVGGVDLGITGNVSIDVKELDHFIQRATKLREFKKIRTTLEVLDGATGPLSKAITKVAEAKLALEVATNEAEDFKTGMSDAAIAFAQVAALDGKIGLDADEVPELSKRFQELGLDVQKVAKGFEEAYKARSLFSKLGDGDRGTQMSDLFSQIDTDALKQAILTLDDGLKPEDVDKYFEAWRRGEAIKESKGDVEAFIDKVADLVKAQEGNVGAAQLLLKTLRDVQGAQVDITSAVNDEVAAREKLLLQIKEQQGIIQAMENKAIIIELETKAKGGDFAAGIEARQFKAEAEDEAEVNRAAMRMRKASESQIKAELEIFRKEELDKNDGKESEEIKASIAAKEAELREKANARMEEVLGRFTDALDNQRWIEEFEALVDDMKGADEKLKKKRKEDQGLAQQVIKDANKDDEEGTTGQAGVSSLAKIGGGGGVGGGGNDEVTIAKNQLEVLRDIADKMGDFNFDDLDNEEQVDIRDTVQNIRNKEFAGEITAEEAKKAIDNLFEQIGNEQRDEKKKEKEDVLALANLRGDEKEEEDKRVAEEKLVEHLEGGNKEQRALAKDVADNDRDLDIKDRVVGEKIKNNIATAQEEGGDLKKPETVAESVIKSLKDNAADSKGTIGTSQKGMEALISANNAASTGKFEGKALNAVIAGLEMAGEGQAAEKLAAADARRNPDDIMSAGHDLASSRVSADAQGLNQAEGAMDFMNKTRGFEDASEFFSNNSVKEAFKAAGFSDDVFSQLKQRAMENTSTFTADKENEAESKKIKSDQINKAAKDVADRALNDNGELRKGSVESEASAQALLQGVRDEEQEQAIAGKSSPLDLPADPFAPAPELPPLFPDLEPVVLDENGLPDFSDLPPLPPLPPMPADEFSPLTPEQVDSATITDTEGNTTDMDGNPVSRINMDESDASPMAEVVAQSQAQTAILKNMESTLTSILADGKGKSGLVVTDIS